jgi:hypothetical protein
MLRIVRGRRGSYEVGVSLTDADAETVETRDVGVGVGL